MRPPPEALVSPSTLTLIEDDPVMGGSLLQRLTLEGYAVDWHRTGRAARTAMTGRPPDAVVCDIRLPDCSGEELYATLRPLAPRASFIFITGYGEVDQAVRLVKGGATDYLTKPFEVAALLDRLGRFIHPSTPAGPLGPSPAMRAVEALLGRVADLESTLLITGESGTGKEVAARLTHTISKRRTAPFVGVNCAAIPDGLIEGELFGYERGAFTGADRQHEGYLARAKNGTLFLDEIGDLPTATQAKLLRVLQEREFTRLGSAKTQRLEARLICATHRDLPTMVRDGRFREDLYYRIAVIPVAVPPLRARRDDVLPLLRDMVMEFAASFKRDVHGLADDVPTRVSAHDWPGNVRELRNRAERAVALCDGTLVRAHDLFPEDGVPEPVAECMPTLAEAREQAERRHIALALEATGGKVEEAARRLGVSRSALFDKLRRQRP